MFFFGKKNNKVSNNLSEDKKITINIKKLREFLGGVENIIGIEFTHTKIKIMVKKRSKVDVDKLNSLKNISGVFAGRGYVTIIVGKQAKKLSNLILI